MPRFQLTTIAAAVLSAAVGLGPISSRAADSLPALQADASRVSISGLSAGAFMAVQYDVAYSASIIGVGVVAGGPYNCAGLNGGVIGALFCMQGTPFGAASVAAAQGIAAWGQIDDTANIAKHKVFLLSGTKDSVVHQASMDAVKAMYDGFGVPAANIVYIKDMPAGHAFISPDFGNLCDVNAAPFIVECKTSTGALFDQPGATLAQIYGPLKDRADPNGLVATAFNQAEFAGSDTGMADTGYVFVPDACKASGSRCPIHVVFHGCKQGYGVVGDDVYDKAGYNSWAASNGIIVLYPQINPTSFPINPQGCWDWWGYTGFTYMTKSAPQMQAVAAMINRLTGAPN